VPLVALVTDRRTIGPSARRDGGQLREEYIAAVEIVPIGVIAALDQRHPEIG